MRGGKGADPTQRSRDFKGTLRRLIRTLRSDRLFITATVVLLVIATVMSVYTPKILGHATDVIVNGIAQGTGIDWSKLARVLGVVIGLYVGYAGFWFISGYIARVVVQNTGFRLRAAAQAKIDRLPLMYIDAKARGDLLSRVTNDIDNVTQTLLQTFTQLVSSIVRVVGITVMMFVLSWKLALVVLLIVPLGMVVSGQIMKRSRVHFRAQWKTTGDVSSTVEEAFTGQQVMAAYNLYDDFNATFDEHNDRLYEVSYKAQFLSGLIQPIMMVLANISYVGVAVLGAFMVISGDLTIGSVQAFIQYARQFTNPVSTVASMINMLQSAAASAERIFDFLDTEEMADDAVAAPADLESGAHGADTGIEASRDGVIEFDHVAFSYEADKPVIRDLSLRVEQGQTVAIVGATGAGKTTLVNLLMRFYEPNSGEIRVDGVPITQMSKDDLRRRIGMVLQDTWLFEGTLAENIAYGLRDDAPVTMTVEEAARATSADRLIRQLPDGYETHVSDEDSGLSQGEKQLITIARAYIAQPEILILDEATSSVDTRTEMLVQRAMAQLRKGRTSFIIAHRLSTIKDADIIVVMENGDVVETGTHESLLAAEGAYYRLYQAQFAGTEV